MNKSAKKKQSKLNKAVRIKMKKEEEGQRLKEEGMALLA